MRETAGRASIAALEFILGEALVLYSEHNVQQFLVYLSRLGSFELCLAQEKERLEDELFLGIYFDARTTTGILELGQAGLLTRVKWKMHQLNVN